MAGSGRRQGSATVVDGGYRTLGAGVMRVGSIEEPRQDADLRWSKLNTGKMC